jgi:predicted aldo/keto reductase-like oxidoreductase
MLCRLVAVAQPKGDVVHGTLGNTGLKVSAIGYGLGRYPDPDIIARCIESGGNYFDTGRTYGGGHSERMFGISIRGKRDKVVIMNIRAMAGAYTPADEKLLYVRKEENSPLYCRRCYQCKGQFPKGVPVTDELRFLAYNDFGPSLEQARLSFMELSREVRSLRCIDCSSCAIECPNGARVRDRLIRAQELLA